MTQRWSHLLFLHWRIEPHRIQSRLPDGLTVDTFDGAAWLGVVPFFMEHIRIRGLPPIPTASDFLELNLRTYVHDARGVPGVWFFSLDANSWLTVQGARQWFGLPYHHAAMQAHVQPGTGRVDYEWRRRGSPCDSGSRFQYQPRSVDLPSRPAHAGTLEFFLVERYLLFATDRRGRLYSGRVWHEPYRIAEADVPHWDDRLIEINGFAAPCRPPDHAVVSPGVDVDVFALERN